MNKNILLLILTLIFIGCATAGKPLDKDKISQIKEGTTTKQEVINLLGNPNSDSLSGDGKEILMYMYLNSSVRPSTYIPVVGLFTGGANQKMQSVQILIGKDEKVEKFISTNSDTPINTGLFNQTK